MGQRLSTQAHASSAACFRKREVRYARAEGEELGILVHVGNNIENLGWAAGGTRIGGGQGVVNTSSWRCGAPPRVQCCRPGRGSELEPDGRDAGGFPVASLWHTCGAVCGTRFVAEKDCSRSMDGRKSSPRVEAAVSSCVRKLPQLLLQRLTLLREIRATSMCRGRYIIRGSCPLNDFQHQTPSPDASGGHSSR